MIYSVSFELGTEVPLGGRDAVHSREDVLARFNDHCSDFLDPDGNCAFFGVTEGVLLAEEAHERGYETESWVLDEGVAPHERDWLSHEKKLNLIAYFKDEKSARAACAWLEGEYRLSAKPEVRAEEEQDWNATWKASFTGIEVDAGLKVLPPWSPEWENARASGSTQGILVINPGAGFGTGTHETTQLCLKVLSGLGDLSGKTVLDFGSGSGILGIAAAKKGARVYCVEVDPLANENARENAALNSVSDRISFLETIPDELKHGRVDILLANILRPILIRFAPEIKSCLKAGSELVLSGLIESDLEPVIATYQEGGAPFAVNRYERNEWRALWLRRNR
ncbi:MAG: 50S ribosomal protein L11 methyltransferase [Proteobacteria bacterium]|nr:50S ribosomal protein L11 methyltransferase [Pseudomonadota bacterium]